MLTVTHSLHHLPTDPVIFSLDFWDSDLIFAKCWRNPLDGFLMTWHKFLVFCTSGLYPVEMQLDTDECFVLCTHFTLRLRCNSFVEKSLCFHELHQDFSHFTNNDWNLQANGFEPWKPPFRSSVKTAAVCVWNWLKGCWSVCQSQCEMKNKACGCELRSVRLALYGSDLISQTDLLSHLFL